MPECTLSPTTLRGKNRPAHQEPTQGLRQRRFSAMKRVAFAAVVAAVVVGALQVPPIQAAANPQLTAHRGIGDSATIPENTIPAFEYAAEHGADIVEFDVQLSSDGEMVVLHDETLDRTTDCTGYVKDRTLAYINACDTEPAGSHPPSFREALTYLKGTDLRMRAELKGTWTSSQVQEFVDEVTLQGLTSRTIVASYSITHLTYAKTHAPSLQRAYLHDGPAPTAATIKKHGSIYIPLLANISAAQVSSLNAAGVTVHVRLGDSPEDYAAMQSTGAPVWVVQNVADAREWLSGN
jgi:glycerophosphoryl diester phosphodiesterase